MQDDKEVRLNKALCEFVAYVKYHLPILRNNYNYLSGKPVSELNNPILNFIIPQGVNNRIGVLFLEIQGTWKIVQHLLKINNLTPFDENIQKYIDFSRIRNRHMGHMVEGKIFFKKERDWIKENYPTGNDWFDLCSFIGNLIIEKIEELIRKKILNEYVVKATPPIRLTEEEVDMFINKLKT
jgi:hypothetical protein